MMLVLDNYVYTYLINLYTKFILRGWPQRQQETLYPYTMG